MAATLRSSLFVFVWTSLAATLTALPPGRGIHQAWNAKEFTAWSIDDARILLTDSPWAKQKPLPAAGRPAMTVIESAGAGAASPSASLGNSANANTGPNMSSGNGSVAAPFADPVHDLSTNSTPSGRSNAIGAPVAHPPVTIFWASATPVRLAILKLRSNGKPIDDREIALRTETRESYIVAVSGLPLPEGRVDAKIMAANATLGIKGKSTVQATEASHRHIGDSDVFFFNFSRSSLPLAVSDGEVEFRMKLGTMEVKQRFKLDQMIYQGRLAL